MLSQISLVLPIGSALLLCLMALYVMRRTRALERIHTEVDASIEEIRNEVQGISHGAMGVGRRALTLEKHIHVLEGRIEEMQKNDPAKVSYSEAARLVELGASVDDLMNTCGISRPEAELVKALTVRNKSVEAEEDIPVLR